MSISARVVLLTCAVVLASLPQAQIAARAANRQAQIVGMNRTNLLWEKPPRQAADLHEMAALGVGAVRVRFFAPVPRFVSLVEAAHDEGIQVLLMFGLNDAAYYPGEESRRAGRGSLHAAYRVSEIDTRRVGTIVKQLFDALDARKLTVAGIEVGNEINWADFNGDFSIDPVTGAGTAAGDPAAARQAFAGGLRAYKTILKEFIAAKAASAVNRFTPIISAGLAEVSDAWRAKTGGEAVPAAEAFEMMEALGFGSLVDGAAVHFYGRGAPSDLGNVERLVGACTVFGRPCWITEWHVGQDGGVNEIECLRATLADPPMASRVAGLFYFQFGNDGPYATVHDGQLTAAGEAAIGRPDATACAAGRTQTSNSLH